MLGDIFIPKGTVIIIPQWTVHRDPDNYQDPHLFKPERFLPENSCSLLPYTFLPFASGPRNCIGMRFALIEIKTCLVKLLQKFKFETCNETQVCLYSFLMILTRWQSVGNHIKVYFILRNWSIFLGKQVAAVKKVVLLIKERTS